MVLLFIGASSNIGGLTSVEPQASDDIIIYAMPYDFDEYSVYTADSYATAQWNSAVYAGLVKRSSANARDYVGDLAQSMPAISTDGKTFSFTLKPNLRFSNGHVLDTRDVKFSFHVALSPAVNTNSYGSYIGFMDNSSVNVIDNLNIEFTLSQSFAFPFGLLSFPIVDEEYFGSRYERCQQGIAEDCLWNNPNGDDVVSAGPFMVSDIDNVHEIVTVIANPFYYAFDSVWADKIIFQKIADKAAAISALASGLIDILDSQYVPSLNELSGLSGVAEDFVGDPSHQEISLNHLNPYFGTGLQTPAGVASASAAELAALNVRKAMTHVVDRNFAVDEIMEGLALPASTVMPAAALGWDATLVPRNFSINVARNYMEMAGFDYADLGAENPDGTFSTNFFEITVLSPNTNPARNQWSANYVLELPKIGISVKEHVSTGWGEIIPRTFGYAGGLPPSYSEGGFDVFFVGYGWALDWNPSSLYDAAGRCDTGDCGNFYNFDLDETMTSVADLIQSYLSELDFDARLLKAKAIQAELYKWIPVLPILYPQSHWGFGASVTGIDSLLISVSAQEWDLVRKSEFTQNFDLTPTYTAPPGYTSTSTGTTTTPGEITTDITYVDPSGVTSFLSMTSPSDITFVEGSGSKTISWRVDGSHPDHYEIYQNGNLVESDGWNSGQLVTLSLDNIQVGNHEFIILLFDTFGNPLEDSVDVTVLSSDTSSDKIDSSDDTPTVGLKLNANYVVLSIGIATFVIRKKHKN
ncbi:MAG: ABC transporter substrate-binding protein [Candidatus Heimdallarchaeota archaeon]|nr:ABC transporter substrate-binding protein [Candidatus Heimdallarchaeota archaeon]